MKYVLNVLSALGIVCFAVAQAVAAERPNVLVILADDLGFSDVGCYGGEIVTPNLNRLAAKGIRFSQFYNTGRCWPTRAALMTGFYPQQIRRDTIPGDPPTKNGKRPAWAPLVSTMLAANGYRTYHSGKWHIDGNPLENGFDHSYRVNDHDRFFRPQRTLEDDRALPPVSEKSGYYLTTGIADYAIKYLREHAKSHRADPFFAYVCFTCPHFPLHALADDIAKYREVYRTDWEGVRRARWQRLQESGLFRGALSDVERNVGPPYRFAKALQKLGDGEVERALPWMELTDQQREFQSAKMAIHAAMVDRMDQEIGRIVDQVRAMNAIEDTLILFLSDNGASAEIMVRGDGHNPDAAPGSAETFLCLGPGWSTVANTPFRRHKTWVHEGGIATPCIAIWPKGIKEPDRIVRTPAHVVDIVPTILELTGCSRARHKAPPIDPPGRSLAGAFRGEHLEDPAPQWWLHEGNRAIREGNWKLVAAKNQGSGDWELYDLGQDRAETKNVADRHPEIVTRLAEKWQEMLESCRRLYESDA